MSRIDITPLADAAILRLLETGRHMELVDTVARIAAPALDRFEPSIIRKVGEQTGRFFPKYFDRKIGQAIVRGVRNWLGAIQEPGAGERAALDE